MRDDIAYPHIRRIDHDTVHDQLDDGSAGRERCLLQPIGNGCPEGLDLACERLDVLDLYLLGRRLLLLASEGRKTFLQLAAARFQSSKATIPAV